MTPPPGPGDLAGIATLADPVRRVLHAHLSGCAGWVTRDDVAAATGFARHVVRLNLDRLAAEGLLECDYRRPPGRSGPGAGRPAKVYRRAEREFTVSVPARRYELAAGILAGGVQRSLESGAPVDVAVRACAREAGRALGRAAAARAGADAAGLPAGRAQVRAAVRAVLDEQGFETRDDGDAVRFGNCPFAGLLRECAHLICTMNGSLVEGVLAGSGPTGLTSRLAPPAPGDCCVSLHPGTH